MTSRIIFSKTALPIILEAFGKSINDEGYIIDSTGELVLTPEGQEIEALKLGALKKGSEIFLKDDLFTVINLVEGK